MGIPLYPAVAMQSEGEEVLLCLDATFDPDGVTQMVVDCGEEDWGRLDDVRLNGMVSKEMLNTASSHIYLVTVII